MTIDPRSHIRGAICALALCLFTALMILGPRDQQVPLSDVVTTIDVTAQQSPPPFFSPTQVSLTTSEAEVVLTNRVPTTWVSVQVFSPSAWTWRNTTGSSTNAMPVLANQIVTVYVSGLGQTFFPVGSGSQTLYVVPVTTVKPTY